MALTDYTYSHAQQSTNYSYMENEYMNKEMLEKKEEEEEERTS